MNTKPFNELKAEAKDKFSFILLGCPNWSPLLPHLTTKKVFEDMIDLLNAVLERTKTDDAKQWLRVCLQEVRQSWRHYEDGNLIKGKDLIQQAEEHFNSTFSKKSIEARFVAGEFGAVRDSDIGFPS